MNSKDSYRLRSTLKRSSEQSNCSYSLKTSQSSVIPSFNNVEDEDKFLYGEVDCGPSSDKNPSVHTNTHFKCHNNKAFRHSFEFLSSIRYNIVVKEHQKSQRTTSKCSLPANAFDEDDDIVCRQVTKTQKSTLIEKCPLKVIDVPCSRDKLPDKFVCDDDDDDVIFCRELKRNPVPTGTGEPLSDLHLASQSSPQKRVEANDDDDLMIIEKSEVERQSVHTHPDSFPNCSKEQPLKINLKQKHQSSDKDSRVSVSTTVSVVPDPVCQSISGSNQINTELGRAETSSSSHIKSKQNLKSSTAISKKDKELPKFIPLNICSVYSCGEQNINKKNEPSCSNHGESLVDMKCGIENGKLKKVVSDHKDHTSENLSRKIKYNSSECSSRNMRQSYEQTTLPPNYVCSQKVSDNIRRFPVSSLKQNKKSKVDDLQSVHSGLSLISNSSPEVVPESDEKPVFCLPLQIQRERGELYELHGHNEGTAQKEIISDKATEQDLGYDNSDGDETVSHKSNGSDGEIQFSGSSCSSASKNCSNYALDSPVIIESNQNFESPCTTSDHGGNVSLSPPKLLPFFSEEHSNIPSRSSSSTVPSPSQAYSQMGAYNPQGPQTVKNCSHYNSRQFHGTRLSQHKTPGRVSASNVSDINHSSLKQRTFVRPKRISKPPKSIQNDFEFYPPSRLKQKERSCTISGPRILTNKKINMSSMQRIGLSLTAIKLSSRKSFKLASIQRNFLYKCVRALTKKAQHKIASPSTQSVESLISAHQKMFLEITKENQRILSYLERLDMHEIDKSDMKKCFLAKLEMVDCFIKNVKDCTLKISEAVRKCAISKQKSESNKTASSSIPSASGSVASNKNIISGKHKTIKGETNRRALVVASSKPAVPELSGHDTAAQNKRKLDVPTKKGKIKRKPQVTTTMPTTSLPEYNLTGSSSAMKNRDNVDVPLKKGAVKRKSSVSSSTIAKLSNLRKFDAATTEDLDKFIVPFTKGWTREIVFRLNISSTDRDVYYCSPTGRKMRSKVEVLKYLSEHKEEGLSIENFTFLRRRIFKEPYEKERNAFIRAKSIHCPVSPGDKKCVSVTKTVNIPKPVRKFKKSSFVKDVINKKKTCSGSLNFKQFS